MIINTNEMGKEVYADKFTDAIRAVNKVMESKPKSIESIIKQLNHPEEIAVVIFGMTQAGYTFEEANTIISHIMVNDKRWLKIYAESESL